MGGEVKEERTETLILRSVKKDDAADTDEQANAEDDIGGDHGRRVNDAHRDKAHVNGLPRDALAGTVVPDGAEEARRRSSSVFDGIRRQSDAAESKGTGTLWRVPGSRRRISFQGDGLDLDAGALGEARDLNGRARGLVVAEELRVDGVHEREVAHVREEDGGLDDLAEA